MHSECLRQYASACAHVSRHEWKRDRLFRVQPILAPVSGAETGAPPLELPIMAITCIAADRSAAATAHSCIKIMCSAGWHLSLQRFRCQMMVHVHIGETC